MVTVADQMILTINDIDFEVSHVPYGDYDFLPVTGKGYRKAERIADYHRDKGMEAYAIPAIDSDGVAVLVLRP